MIWYNTENETHKATPVCLHPCFSTCIYPCVSVHVFLPLYISTTVWSTIVCIYHCVSTHVCFHPVFLPMFLPLCVSTPACFFSCMFLPMFLYPCVFLPLQRRLQHKKTKKHVDWQHQTPFIMQVHISQHTTPCTKTSTAALHNASWQGLNQHRKQNSYSNGSTVRQELRKAYHECREQELYCENDFDPGNKCVHTYI